MTTATSPIQNTQCDNKAGTYMCQREAGHRGACAHISSDSFGVRIQKWNDEKGFRSLSLSPSDLSAAVSIFR